MKYIALGLAFVFAGITFAQNTNAMIEAMCLREWAGDFEMQAYCEQNQRDAVLELDQLTSTQGGIPEEAFKTAFSGCVRDWAQDFEMQVYCIRNQIDGYNSVARGPESPDVRLTTEETDMIRAHCANEWPGDFEMQAYCERQQAEGAAFLRNQPASVSESTWSAAVRACEFDWPNDFGMRAYCVRQTFY